MIIKSQETLTISTAVVVLTSSKYLGSTGPNARNAEIMVLDAPINVRLDGTNASATYGADSNIPYEPGSVFHLNELDKMLKFTAIKRTGALKDAKIVVTYEV